MKKSQLAFIKFYLLINVLFILIYFPTAHHAANSVAVWEVSFSWEKSIPFIDWMILPYLSFSLFLLLPMFYLDENGIKSLGSLMAVITLFSGLIFWLFPTQVNYTPMQLEYSVFSTVYSALYAIDSPFNALPSLHVSYAYAATLFYAVYAPDKHKLFLYSWFFCIVLSVLFTHQHHVFDIMAAILLVHSCLLLTQGRIVLSR